MSINSKITIAHIIGKYDDEIGVFCSFSPFLVIQELDNKPMAEQHSSNLKNKVGFIGMIAFYDQ